jgi:hypothetical protein
MKKSILSFVFITVFAVVGFAQQTTELYKFSTPADAEKVLKVLNTELKLSPNDFSLVRNLLEKSALSQSEFAKGENAKDVATAKIILERQTRHIEGNLKNIIGEERFKAYEASKPAISKKVADFGKN